MRRHAKSLISISVIIIFSLFLALSVSPIPLGSQNRGEAIADPGSGWEEFNLEDVEAVYNVFPVNSSVVWIAGQDHEYHGVVYKTDDGGQTWAKKHETPYSYGGLLCRVFALDENTAWFYGARIGDEFMGFVDSTSDGGANWETVSSTQYKWPVKLVALDENNLWVLGVEVYWLPSWPSGSSTLYSVGYVERSSDGGMNWVRQYSYLFREAMFNPAHDPLPFIALPYSFDLEVVDSTTAWGVIYDRVIKTENWGWTWDIQLSDDFAFLPGNVSAIDSTTAWAALNGEIKKTTDGGSSWETQYVAETGELIRDIAATEASVVWALLSDIYYSSAGFGIYNGRPLKTVDAGISWLQQDIPGTYSLVDIEALDAATAWTAGGGGVVLKTTDGGDPKPDFVSISPASGAVDAEVTITGCDFGDTQDSSYVNFDDVQVIEYASWSDSEIKVKVPSGTEGELLVTVTTPEGTSNGKPFTVSSSVPPLPCGPGSGTALLMLGLTLGLLSLAGTAGMRRRKR